MSRWQRQVGHWALIAAFALLWPLALPYSEATRNANELPRVLQSVALADQGHWHIDTQIKAGYDPGPDIASYGGHRFPNKAPGVSVLGALLVKLGDLFGVEWTLRSFTFGLRLISSAIPTMLLLWAFARHFAERYGASVCVVAGLLYVMATPVLSYSRLAYGHTLAGALSLIGLLLILDARQAKPEAKRADLRAALGGFLCALAISADYMAVFWGPALAIGLGYETIANRRVRLSAFAGAGALVGILPLALYHATVFDSLWSTGYHHSATQAFAEKHGQGLLGLTLPSLSSLHRILTSAKAGLLWWMPLALVGGMGLWHEQRGSLKTRFEGRVFLGVIATGLLVNLGLNFEGGWRVGPRYLLPFLPVILPGLAFMLARQRGDHIKVLLLGAVVFYSLGINLAAASLWPHFDVSHVNSPVAEVLWPLLAAGKVSYGVASKINGTFPALIYLYFPLALVWYFYGKLQFGGFRSAFAWVGAALLGGCAAMVLPRMIPAHPDAQRNLAYIEKVFEPLQSGQGSKLVPGRSRALPRVHP